MRSRSDRSVGWSCYPSSLCYLLDVCGSRTLESLSIIFLRRWHNALCIMFSVIIDTDGQKRGPTSRPVVGTEIQRDFYFEAHIYHFSYRLVCISSRWFILSSQLPYNLLVQPYRCIILHSYLHRLIHKDFSHS